MDKELREKLISAAWQAREQAYVPYSGFAVGAAALGGDGRIYSGCNIENASYGLTNCAERTAVFNMVSQGCQHLTAIAVCGGDGKPVCFPCGACRQVIAEFAVSKEIPVLICGADGSWLEMTADELLPHSFELAGE